VAKITYLTLFGNAKPVSDNRTEERRAKNGRVELTRLDDE